MNDEFDNAVICMSLQLSQLCSSLSFAY